ncbi:hypothetical protein BKA66DRAFT_90691 [Pyrenochaeta sp. MPI-SDFR-AT-0127]|nr:hypothetical protein BKA66DRAFT_90691 [Pyrenochaeta sp. MPI-SDFR-AT-0127]
MASRPPKRPADSSWKSSEASKAARNFDTDAILPMTQLRRDASLEDQVGSPLHNSQLGTSASRQSFQCQLPASASDGVPERSPSRAPFPSTLSQTPSQSKAPELTRAISVSDQSNVGQPTPYKPAVLHKPHPDSKLCQDFHWVPYPLGLMPYDSWHKLHHREETHPPLPFRCPVCRRERKLNAHMRKVFLVAERLTWEEGLVSIHDKDLNEELNWNVNFELGILDPFVEDPEQVVGGKNSRNNKFYPYQNDHEMKLALKLIFMTENITKTSWAVWIGTQLDLETMLNTHGETYDVPVFPGTASEKRKPQPPPVREGNLARSPDHASQFADKSGGLKAPPPSLEKSSGGLKSSVEMRESNQGHSNISPSDVMPSLPSSEPTTTSKQSTRIVSYKTLQDFYCLLDRIERTSYVGALFLEAYAEKLRDDMCQTCWFKHNVKLDCF